MTLMPRTAASINAKTPRGKGAEDFQQPAPEVRHLCRLSAQRQQQHAVHFRDFVFVRFAHVNDLDAEARIIERLLHVLHGDFVGYGNLAA